ncbi:PucR family transcriptional regulator [Shouchella shacheensis]|uniref:PucR family transcriptional regulator n=1 Tax=Shouchella shacheensis TaxID=1649580 RepID=UPI00073FB379|nr:PucR family transcriptional regulator [Shouchella shacheensis]
MKTVNDLFMLDQLKEATVLAGHRGLSRGVQTVNISDTPDAINFLNVHELLLTSGYAFKDRPGALCRLVEQMSERNCSGIIIKLQRYLLTLPEEVQLLADSLAFPIIDVPMEETLGELSQNILNLLNDAKAEQLYYAMHLHRKFSSMMIKGYSLQSLVEQIGYFIERPTLLLDHRGQPLIASQSHSLSRRWDESIKQRITQVVRQNPDKAQKGETFMTGVEGIESVTTFPVPTKRQQPNMLVIANAVTLDYPLSETAVEQAANVLSFTLLKEQAIEENVEILKNNFFSDLIEGRIESGSEMRSRCAHYGLTENVFSIMAVCDSQKSGQRDWNDKAVAETHRFILEHLEDAMLEHSFEGVLFTKETYVAMVLQFDQYDDSVLEEVKNFLHALQKQFAATGAELSFGVSNYIQQLQNLAASYNEALEALQTGRSYHSTPFVQVYKVREMKELLQMVPQKNLQEFYRNTLQSLAHPESKEMKELTKTLHVYLDAQCEISETARKLYVHRNTVKYRIEKIETLLGCVLRDPLDSLRLRTALLVGSLIREKS